MHAAEVKISELMMDWIVQNISKNIRIGWIGLYIVHFLRMPRLAKLGDFLEFFRRLGENKISADCNALCQQSEIANIYFLISFAHREFDKVYC